MTVTFIVSCFFEIFILKFYIFIKNQFDHFNWFLLKNIKARQFRLHIITAVYSI